jgi:hypothetical protein
MKLKKSPIWNKEPRNKHLLDYLRSTGGDPDETHLREMREGVRQKRAKMPSKVHRDDDRDYGLTRLNIPNMTGSPFSEHQYTKNNKNNTNFTHFYQSADKKVRAGIKHLGDNRYGVDHYGVSHDSRYQGVGKGGFDEMRRELEAMHGGPVELTGIGQPNPDALGFWDKMNQDNIIQNMVVVKEAKSPAAIEHKRKYETEYESSPKRKKYRRDLERERRKRGVDGKGGGDMSHTKTGKIVVEDPHTNRARSHPSVGSTLKMVIVKAPLVDAPLQPGQANVNEQFTVRGLSDFVNLPPGQAFASSDRQARGAAVSMRGPKQIIDAHTGDGHGPHWSIPAFEHIAERGEGKGRKYLEEMIRELKQKRDMPIRVVGATHKAIPFWDKMTGEGVIDSAHLSPDANDPRPHSLHYPGHPDYEKYKHLTKPQSSHHNSPPRGNLLESLFSGMPDRNNPEEREKERILEDEEREKRWIENTKKRGREEYERLMQQYHPNIETGEPMDISMRLLKEQKKLFVQGQKTLDGQPAFLPADFKAEQERRVTELNAINEKEARRQKLIEQAKTLGMTTPLPQYYPSANKD